jgi:hypothetical protein
MDLSFKGTKFARKVITIGLIKSHFDQVRNMIISDWGTKVWFWDELEAWEIMITRLFDCGVYLAHIFGTQIEDQDQAQDEDEV